MLSSLKSKKFSFLVKSAIICFLLCSLYTFPQAEPNEADGILGEWLTENKEAKFLIYKTAQGYEGKISWLKKPLMKRAISSLMITTLILSCVVNLS